MILPTAECHSYFPFWKYVSLFGIISWTFYWLLYLRPLHMISLTPSVFS